MSDERDEIKREAFESEGQFALRAVQELAARLEQHSREVNQKFDVVADHLATLAVSQQQLTEKVNRTADSVNALLAIAEIHDQEIKATDERLNALVGVVERLIERR
ncbi:MAG TPA: hypothetical protein VF527_13050 [Pyrinomonadaceae bacterium]|jgi:uncharacterized membrane-anchored protein YhcB (DUF1043 family)